MLRFLLLSVVFLYLLSTLFPQFHLGAILSVLSLVIVICTFWQAKHFVRILGGIFVILGAVLLWSSRAQWQDYLFSFGPMLDLLTLFSLIPILGISIKLGDYSRSVETIVQKRVKNTGQLYRLTSGISYFFSIFMNLATLPMTYYTIKPVLSSFPINEESRFMSRSIIRGFAMPLVWSPVTPIVGIVIGMTGVNWISILPYAIPLSIFGIGLDWFISSKKSNKKLVGPSNETRSELEASKIATGNERPIRILQIGLAIILFNIAISFLESQFAYSFLIIVSILVIPFSFIWSLLLKKGSEFLLHLIEHLKSFSITMNDQFFIFLCAGFFISTIGISQTDVIISNLLLEFIDNVGGKIFLILLPLIPLAFAFLGLHPAVSLSLMAGVLNPEIIDISPTHLTIAMLAGAVSSFLVGPFNATLGLMSNIIKVSSYKVSNWNLAYTGLYIGCAMIYLVLLEILAS